MKSRFLAALTTSVIVASSASADQLQLRGGVLNMPTLGTEAAHEKFQLLATRSDASHVVVRLNAEAGAKERAQMKAQGLELLTCLGPHTWIAGTNGDLLQNIPALSQRIAWVGELENSWKIQPWLAAGNIPMWTVQRDQIEAARAGKDIDPERLAEQLAEMADPRIVVYVLLHGDVQMDGVVEALSLMPKTKILSTMESINGLVLRVPASAIQQIVRLDEILWIEAALPQLSDMNDSNRVVAQVDQVQESPYNLDGTDVTVMVYDGGYADAGHPDFGGRLSVQDSAGQSSHATHVCGTVGGDGTNSGGTYRGMAPNATIVSYGFEQEGGLSEGFLYTDPGDLEADYGDAINNWGAVIANNSIGTNTAPNGFPCEWTGDYGVTSNLIDSVVRGALGAPIRIVWANGNERQTDRCGDLYNTTAPPACAKNHITVGALNSNDESMTYFSSWGPADDGRIKPDITGPGCQSDDDGGVTSSTPGGGYSSYCGTSMSSPTVCGIGALIIQEWRNLNPGKGDLWNSSLKALLANSGVDLGNPGPDCLYGFGTVRAKNAIDAMRNESLIEGEVSDGSNYEFLVLVGPEDGNLKITLAWDDEAASPLPSNALVNDLDLVVLSPAGERYYPWTIDPADPGAPATQGSEDHINNMEQVSVESPMSGAWRVQIRGTSVPVGPQTFSVASDPQPTQCSRSGIVSLDRQYYPLDSALAVTVVDCDLNTDDTVTETIEVLLTSDDEPTGETILLIEEDPAAAVFSGAMEIASTNSPGVLYALNGSQVIATYIDAEDADGNTNVEQVAVGFMDGEAPSVSDVAVTEYHPDGATIAITSSEPVRILIRYGSTCDSLNDELTQTAFLDTHEIRIRDLIDTFSYAFSIELEDRAGNTAGFDNNGKCWQFTIPDFLDLFAEQFGSFDLDGYSLRFDVIATADAYIPCAQKILALPVNPSDGSSISLSDDSSQSVSLPTPITFYGNSYSTMFINSNGSVTFVEGSTSYTESMSIHFERIGVSMFFDDLNPTLGGSISWKTSSEGISVTFENISEYGESDSSNTFQVVFGYDESVTIAWLGMTAQDAIVGLSPGTGTDPQFIPSDFSNSSEGCLPRPPTSGDLALSVLPGTELDFDLYGTDDGLPDPPGAIEFVVLSLPQWPLRDMTNGEVITNSDLPYTLPDSDNPTLRYEPVGIWEGNDGFEYLVDDGGTPPEGGPSAVADVSIVVATGPQVVYSVPMDVEPGWSYEGDWAFGTPTGSGGDPSSGATGDFVVGYNLNGAYPNNLPEYSVTTGSFDCSDLNDTTLRFKRWLGVESSTYDHAMIQVSVNGGEFSTIWNHEGSSFQDTSWVDVEYDISEIADGQADVRFRWVMGSTDGSVTYSGWNIDDFEVFAVIPNDTTVGDLNGDGLVTGADVGLFLVQWGECSGCSADFNDDGIVDGVDFGILLAAWTGNGGFVPSHEDSRVAVSDPFEFDGAITETRLVNSDRLAPREHGGVVIAPTGYVQLDAAELEIEVDGSLPIVDHDMLVVLGEAELAGRLELLLQTATPDKGVFIVLLAENLIGDFDEVTVLGQKGAELTACTTDRAVLVQIGAPDANLGIEPPLPSDVVGLIDAIGTENMKWDLDGNGEVDYSDLKLLLDDVNCSK